MITSESKVKQMEISAIITRADGTIENLGTIQYWHKNPLKRIIWRIKKWLHY
jgi:hypothetical protein